MAQSLKFTYDTYPENENSWKSITIFTVFHIYNVQTRGIQHKSIMKLALQPEGNFASYYYNLEIQFRDKIDIQIYCFLFQLRKQPRTIII